MKKRREDERHKIIFFSPVSNLYGASRSLMLILENIDRSKYEPYVVTTERGQLITEVKKLKIPIYLIRRDTIPFFSIKARAVSNKFMNLFLFGCVKIFNRIILFLKYLLILLALRPSLIYVNTIVYSSPILVAKILQIPVIVHMREHEIYLTYRNILTKIHLMIILRVPNQFICVSQTNKELLLKRLVPSHRVAVIYNGVDPEKFKLSKIKRWNIRRELYVDENEVLIGIIGAVTPIKGIDYFIQTAGLIRKDSKCSKFLVIGDITNKVFFQKTLLPLCKQYNLGTNISFIGFKENIVDYISALDIVVNTSRMEPFGRVNIEAMALSRPVVATKIGGNQEVIVDGKTGYLVPANDSQNMAKKILLLINNSKQRIRFGKNGRRRVERLFTVNQYYSNIEKILGSILISARVSERKKVHQTEKNC